MIVGLNASLLITSSGTATDSTTPRNVPTMMPMIAPKVDTITASHRTDRRV